MEPFYIPHREHQIASFISQAVDATASDVAIHVVILKKAAEVAETPTTQNMKVIRNSSTSSYTANSAYIYKCV